MSLGYAEDGHRRRKTLYGDTKGEVLAKLGKLQEAREVFAQVRKLDPHSATLAATMRRLQL